MERQMKKARIIAFATWFPETIRENNEWPQVFIDNFVTKQMKEDDKVLVDLKVEETDNDLVIEYLKREYDDPFLGTSRRRVASEATTAVEAETQAAKKVLEKAGVSSSEIGLVFSYSTLPDRIAPSSANAVAYNINSCNAHCMSVDTGCASALSQMMVAQSMIETGQVKYALLVQSHVVLRGWPLLHPASPSVGDGATAILMGPSEKETILGSYALSKGEHYTSVTYTRGKQEDDSWWLPNEKGFYLGSHNSEKAKELIFGTINSGRDSITQALNDASRKAEDIDLLISVQPRKWIPEGIARALQLSPTVALQTFEEYAHLGPCGIVANLEEAEKQNLLKPGTVVALYAQGAGFCATSMILEW